MGELDAVQAEINNDLLDAWIKVYAKAQTIYDGLPSDEKLHIEEHGHEVESLVWVIVQMKPHVRALCWSLVEQGRAASVSHPAPRVEHTVDETAQAKAGGENVGGEQDERIAALEAENRMLRAALVVIEAASTSATSGADRGLDDLTKLRRQRDVGI